jgi:nucleosome binding factor SPN SPT16 subunit
MKKLISLIEHSIDQSQKVKHTELASKIEQLIDSPNEKTRLLTQFKLQEGSYDLAFPPIIQSGG